MWAAFHPVKSNWEEQRENTFQSIVFSELWSRYPAHLSLLLQAAQGHSQCCELTLKSADCNTLLQCCHQRQTGCLPWDYCLSPDLHVVNKVCNKKRNSNVSRSFFPEQSHLQDLLVKPLVHGVRRQNGNGAWEPRFHSWVDGNMSFQFPLLGFKTQRLTQIVPGQPGPHSVPSKAGLTSW